jgi:hypothetical protein
LNLAQLHFPFSVYQFFFGNNQAYPFGMTVGLAPKGPPVMGWDSKNKAPFETLVSFLDAIDQKLKIDYDYRMEVLERQALEQGLLVRNDQGELKLTNLGRQLAREFYNVPCLPDMIYKRLDIFIGQY